MSNKDQDLEARIRERAYQLWEQGGGEHGSHEAHWEQARKLLMADEDAGKPLEMQAADAADTDGAPTDVAAETASVTEAPSIKPAKKAAAKKPAAEPKPARPAPPKTAPGKASRKPG